MKEITNVRYLNFTSLNRVIKEKKSESEKVKKIGLILLLIFIGLIF